MLLILCEKERKWLLNILLSKLMMERARKKVEIIATFHFAFKAGEVGMKQHLHNRSDLSDPPSFLVSRILSFFLFPQIHQRIKSLKLSGVFFKCFPGAETHIFLPFLNHLRKRWSRVKWLRLEEREMKKVDGERKWQVCSRLAPLLFPRKFHSSFPVPNVTLSKTLGRNDVRKTQRERERERGK